MGWCRANVSVGLSLGKLWHPPVWNLGSAWSGQVGTPKGISQDPALMKINKSREQFPPAPQGFQAGKVWLLTSHQTWTFIFRLLFHLPHPPNCHCCTDSTWALLPKITISGHAWQRNDWFKLSAALEMSLADVALDVTRAGWGVYGLDSEHQSWSQLGIWSQEWFCDPNYSTWAGFVWIRAIYSCH